METTLNEAPMTPATGLCGINIGGFPFSHLYSDMSCFYFIWFYLIFFKYWWRWNNSSNSTHRIIDGWRKLARVSVRTHTRTYQFNKQKSISHTKVHLIQSKTLSQDNNNGNSSNNDGDGDGDGGGDSNGSANNNIDTQHQWQRWQQQSFIV